MLDFVASLEEALRYQWNEYVPKKKVVSEQKRKNVLSDSVWKKKNTKVNEEKEKLIKEEKEAVSGSEDEGEDERITLLYSNVHEK